ncbi:MAG TPA: hypothetical protein V6D00_13395 [Pantanalinema sp.]
MEREAELERLYDQAMELTRLQSDAIAVDAWDEFVHLLDERAVCFDAAEQLLAGPTLPANRAALKATLSEMQTLDLQNQAAFQRKRHTLMRELSTVDRSKDALSGYMEAYGDPIDPQFLDHEQ